MRISLAALTLVLLVPAASSQSQYGGGQGAYFGFSGPGLSWTGGDFSGFGMRGEGGRRLGNGVDVGLLGAFSHYGLHSDQVGVTSWTLGTTAGIARPAPLGTVARLAGLVAYRDHAGDYANGERLDRSYLIGDVTASLGKEIPLVGSVRVQPTAGLFAQFAGALDVDASDTFAPNRESKLYSGIQLELPVLFRVLGKDAVLSAGYRILPGQASGATATTAPGLTFRVNF